MLSLRVLLLLLAFVAFVLSTFGVASRVNLASLGLALWVLALLFG